jgi:hypothetical protein
MGAESLREAEGWKVKRVSILLFLIALAIFLISPVVQVSDSRYSALLSECLMYHHTPALDVYSVPKPRNPGWGAGPQDVNAYELAYGRGGSVTYFFPHGSSILSIPLVGILNALGVSAATPGGRFNLLGEILIERVVASILMAGLTCVFFHSACLMLPITWSCVVALGAALGSQIWSTASRGLWGHTWLVLLVGLVVDSLLTSEHRHARLHPIWIATLLAWSYFVRPTGSIPIAATTIYVLVVHRDYFFVYAATGAAWAVAFAGYWLWAFGSWLPPYYSASRLASHDFTTRLAAVMISPSRGLFVYAPVALFPLYLVARYWREVEHRGLALLALAAIAMQIAMISNYPWWHGGYCYGPRLLTESIPWFVLLAILGLDAMRHATVSSRHGFEIAAAIFLLALSVAINGRGAWSFAGMDWNPIESHGIFDWRYPQFMAGLINPPKE